MKHKTRKKRIVRRKRRVVRRNPYITKDGDQRVLYGYAKNGMELLGTGLKISKGDLVLLTPATNIPGGGYFARPGYPTGLWKQVSKDDSIYIRPSDFKKDITFKKTAFGSKEFMRQMRGNSLRRNSMSESYKKRSNRYLVTKKFTSGYMKGMTIVDESPVPLYVGFKPSKPYFGSPYIVTKTQVNFTGKRSLLPNPPMYAHGMTAHRTHGLSLKQMMKLYRLVSSGNQKAVMYARRTLGIPMSESLSQVKAVVYHHMMDLRGKM